MCWLRLWKEEESDRDDFTLLLLKSLHFGLRESVGERDDVERERDVEDEIRQCVQRIKWLTKTNERLKAATGEETLLSTLQALSSNIDSFR